MSILYSQKLKRFPIQHGFSTKSYSNSDHIIFPRQKHTNNVINADDFAKYDADAIVASKPNIRIGIKTADCVPILLFEENRGMIAAVHAGWQGTAKEIVKITIERLVEMGGRPRDIYACLGPAIGECCYNIPEERASYFHTKFVHRKNGQAYLNLKNVNIQQLTDMGVLRKNIELTPWCTSCNNDLFYSYRHEKPLIKQNISFIELN